MNIRELVKEAPFSTLAIPIGFASTIYGWFGDFDYSLLGLIAVIAGAGGL